MKDSMKLKLRDFGNVRVKEDLLQLSKNSAEGKLNKILYKENKTLQRCHKLKENNKTVSVYISSMSLFYGSLSEILVIKHHPITLAAIKAQRLARY